MDCIRITDRHGRKHQELTPPLNVAAANGGCHHRRIVHPCDADGAGQRITALSPDNVRVCIGHLPGDGAARVCVRRGVRD